MAYNPDIHHRRSIRLKGYDYSQAGAYFITVCTQGRELLLGDVVDAETRPNEVGQLVAQTWDALPVRFPGLDLDAFVVMPNHIHRIILLDTDPSVGALLRPEGTRASSPTASSEDGGIPQNRAGEKGAASSAPTLGTVMRAFKSISAVSCNRLLGRANQPFWQRNYHEHVIRNEITLEKIRRYIDVNPANWAMDPDNPQSQALPA